MTPATLAPPATTALSVEELTDIAVARAQEEFGFDHKLATDVVRFMITNGVTAYESDGMVIIDCMPGNELYEAFDKVAEHDGVASSDSTLAAVQNALSATLDRPATILHTQTPIAGRLECVQRTIMVEDNRLAA